ncbi:MAG: hypothetical protein KDD69_15755 [Bdellovibrionales bacterium]|nr:hypothetical protein [Bdellovibrionales bacterium]
MFRSNQVLCATKLIRQFARISQELQDDPQALLITQKGKDPLVLVNAEIFEDLLHRRFEYEAIDWNTTTDEADL